MYMTWKSVRQFIGNILFFGFLLGCVIGFFVLNIAAFKSDPVGLAVFWCIIGFIAMLPVGAWLMSVDDNNTKEK